MKTETVLKGLNSLPENLIEENKTVKTLIVIAVILGIIYALGFAFKIVNGTMVEYKSLMKTLR